ncbi:POP1-domain-containing protein [Gonapodya prolifera JEL478]|uniref:POP1-domain-containing protein n=1 Tax=Gonapodya prolifera (strain JEL478) TaxID=1344416 RepID=A0A139AQ89_GONPJ|nr:POP1-domain-containing protein [Gonapodya prolifera JEL478]|eukprot:KXS18909.1 POP1-domain-containing protein [Gonapodya prolifera JEL478]
MEPPSRPSTSGGHPQHSSTSTDTTAPPAVPRTLSATDFASHRAHEIHAMERFLSQNTELKGGLRVFQTIARHLRRRAASWNIKRLPKLVRDRAIKEAEKDPRSKQKVSKRTISRATAIRKSKGISLMEDYKRRAGQEGRRWLETHVWHAKRMHMVHLWGFKLADHPNDKSTKATHRHALHQSFIHDASYTRCVEISGPVDFVVRVVDACADPGAISVGSKRFTGGVRQGATVLYDTGAWPGGLLGPVTFMWRREGGGETEASQATSPNRQLWLFVHPSLLTAILASLHASLALLPPSTPVTVRATPTPLLRFELTGPRSLALLRHILHPVDPSDPLVGPAVDAGWSRPNATAWTVWNDIEGLRSAASLPPGCVLGLSVWDPRLRFPRAMPPRNPLAPSTASALTRLLASWPADAGSSSVWDEQLRTRLADRVPLERDLNARRNQNLVPGTPLAPALGDPIVPVLILQRGMMRSGEQGGRGSREVECGVDLLVPQGWGAAFWKAMSFAGGVAGGLQDRRFLHFEASMPCFPYDFPSSAPYVEWASGIKAHAEELYGRKPPAKRVNYAKNGVRSPFGAEWARLVDRADEADERGLEANLSGGGFWVLETPAVGKVIRNMFEGGEAVTPEAAISALIGVMSAVAAKRGLAVNESGTLEGLERALVRVRVDVVGRGRPEANFFVRSAGRKDYEAVEKDMETFLKRSGAEGKKRFGGGEMGEDVEGFGGESEDESMDDDDDEDDGENEDEDEECDVEMLNGDESDGWDGNQDGSHDEGLGDGGKGKKSIIMARKRENDPLHDRTILGFVTSGQYSYAEGRGRAFACVALRRLFEMQSVNVMEGRRYPNLVLVQSTRSLARRAALLTVCT